MTQYQYWRGNIYLGDDNSIVRSERPQTCVCPYCGAESQVIYERHLMENVRDEEGRQLWIFKDGKFRRKEREIWYDIGCTECVEEYERYQKGWGYGYGLDYDPDIDGPEVDE